MRLEPIGIIHTPFSEAAGTPIQSSTAKGSQGTIEVFSQFVPGLKDLDGFDRIWLLYWFDRAAETRLVLPTYLDDTPHGLFATRAPCRPNPIGISSVKLLVVEKNLLHVEDIDILDGTPLLDIKPYSPHFDCFEAKHSGWLDPIWKGQKAKNAVADDRFSQKDNDRGPAK